MKEQLEELKNLLKEESELEEARKPLNKRLTEIKKIKEGLAEEISKQMKTDNYSNEFCTIMRNKKLAIEVINNEEAMNYMKAETVITIDEAKVEEMFNAMYRQQTDELQSAEFSGLKVSEFYKPTIRKKKDGLEE